ncbi:MAG TPA: hypothetical protein DEO31_00925 [Streptococcus sp.]|nr:hypothetical protein [Streptococcus sp.]
MLFLLFLLHPSLRIGSPKTKKELVCLYDFSILAHLLIIVNHKIHCLDFYILDFFVILDFIKKPRKSRKLTIA